MNDKLAQEIATFEKHRADLEKSHPGKFVLIKGDEVLGTFDTFENAAAEGVRLFPKEDFLIRQIGAPVAQLSPAIVYGLTGVHSEGRLRA